MEFDTEDARPMYFGDPEKHARVVATLQKAVAQGEGGMHLVTGGPSTGKSEALRLLNESINNSRKFDHLVEPEMMGNPDDPESVGDDIPDDVPPALKQLIQDMHHCEEAYVQHHVFKSYDKIKGKDFIIVIADGETPLTEPDRLALLKRAANLVADKQKGYELLWVADVPVLDQGIPIFKPDSNALKMLNDHRSELREFRREYPKVKAHELAYHLPTIQKTLREGIEQDGNNFIKLLAGTTHKTSDPQNQEEWQRACDAVLAGDEKAYKSAFNVLAARAKAGRDRAA